jgi:hypothetical protein
MTACSFSSGVNLIFLNLKYTSKVTDFIFYLSTLEVSYHFGVVKVFCKLMRNVLSLSGFTSCF